jgi:hypothetical protein
MRARTNHIAFPSKFLMRPQLPICMQPLPVGRDISQATVRP